MEKKIILLADDDMDDTEMFCEALADIDESVICHTAENGSEALKILASLDQSPGVIFLDLNMPIMNGWECLKELKSDQRYKDIPVIMISTSSHRNDMDTAANLGAVCYFVKPNNFKDLKHVLKIITSNLNGNLKEAIKEIQAGNLQHVFVCDENNLKS
ncbi:response regulator [Flavobacterium sp. 17A]|uniref:Response regulator n=1 Tax=Flavobacterium potami TaxID=2872310 RepID=A0A9X1H766_9FLAO|nr:response regulator [Flavobacterium potami]MBZ4033402.1 response regulator [Flavobacterium potami]